MRSQPLHQRQVIVAVRGILTGAISGGHDQGARVTVGANSNRLFDICLFQELVVVTTTPQFGSGNYRIAINNGAFPKKAIASLQPEIFFPVLTFVHPHEGNVGSYQYLQPSFASRRVMY